MATYNDIDSVKQLFAAHPKQIAALIIEPIAGNMGCVLPKEGFLEALRALCDQEGTLLIFDEVMTGFRLAKGGAQEALHINADIVTFGKVIGGGLPVGAFAANKEIMSYLAPEGNNISFDAKDFLCSTFCQAEAGHHLIKYQKCAIFSTQLSQSF